LKIQIALVGAFIGLLAGGPVGGIVGFLIGMYVEYIAKDKPEDEIDEKSNHFRSSTGQSNDFGMALLILVAAIMNADGVAKKSELELVKRMLVRTYGETRAQEMLLLLRELIKQKQDISIVCRQIRGRMVYSQRLELMHVLFRISRADNDINADEIQMLNYIAVQLGISTPDFLSLRAMFITTPDSEYKILDVAQNADEDEVKKAYRKMAMRFHPDRLQGLNENERKAAEEKFLRVKKAYDSIKSRNGWK
jgi:DnaJ like chaperone protein